MGRQSDEMYGKLERIFDAFPQIHSADIPGIDLYMDQVTTFLEDNLRSLTRDPESGKLLTKTMINNYVKNKVLFPPVKKKYSREHMMLLIMIFYMKSFLSIGDIRSITGPIMDRYAPAPAERPDRRKESEQKKAAGAGPDKKTAPDEKQSAAAKQPGIRDIYEEIIGNLDKDLPRIRRDIEEQIDLAAEDFADMPEEDRDLLQRFSLICRLSAEVYMRKLFIEKLLDEEDRRSR